jgi:lipoate-protein ligase A
MSDDRNEQWRLVRTPPYDGATNMALDEALLEAVSEGISAPTLRLYAWDPPCLSLGYAQPIADANHQRLHELDWDLVRRPTGGRAILHIDELTYAVIGQDTHRYLSGGVLASYRRLSAGLVKALACMELAVEVQPDAGMTEEERTNPICFQVPSAYEITVAGKKLVGSAQVRRRGGVLQHGSIPLRGDLTRICQVLHFSDGTDGDQACKAIAESAGTVGALLGREVSWDEAAQAMVDGFSEALGLTFEVEDPTEAELEQAQELVERHYANPSWTARV